MKLKKKSLFWNLEDTLGIYFFDPNAKKNETFDPL